MFCFLRCSLKASSRSSSTSIHGSRQTRARLDLSHNCLGTAGSTRTFCLQAPARICWQPSCLLALLFLLSEGLPKSPCPKQRLKEHGIFRAAYPVLRRLCEHDTISDSGAGSTLRNLQQLETLGGVQLLASHCRSLSSETKLSSTNLTDPVPRQSGFDAKPDNKI